MSQVKKITVITPSYMQGQYIADCLQSVQSQGFGEIEHIVIDALSTDGTREAISNAASRDGYELIKVFEKDSGPADAINKGMDLATGDVVCWLNADDTFFDKNTLGCVADYFNSHPHVDVITANGYYIDDAGKYVAPIVPTRAELMSYESLMYLDPFLQPSTFWRKNPIRLNEGLKYLFDWQFFIDLYRSGMNWIYLPVTLSCYRLQENSLTFQDKAIRRYEVYQMACSNQRWFGQRGWCYAVYVIYRASELTGLAVIKKICGKLNKLLGFLSFGKLYSS